MQLYLISTRELLSVTERLASEVENINKTFFVDDIKGNGLVLPLKAL